MKEVRPVMPWVKVYVRDDVIGMHAWCIDKLGPGGVNWYASIREGADLFYSFRYEEDATAFKLKFGL